MSHSIWSWLPGIPIILLSPASQPWITHLHAAPRLLCECGNPGTRTKDLMLVSQPFSTWSISTVWDFSQLTCEGERTLVSFPVRTCLLTQQKGQKSALKLTTESNDSTIIRKEHEITRSTVQHTEPRNKMGDCLTAVHVPNVFHTWDPLNDQCYYTQTKRRRHCCNLQHEWRFKRVKERSWNDFGWMHHI